MSTEAEMLRILVVDDQSLFREGLHVLLDRQEHFSVVGEASDGLDAVVQARELMPDVILMDIRMPRATGLAALRQIQMELPSINVLMLTVSEDDDDLFAAVKAGARGYLLKTIDAQELVKAVEHVGRGGAVISPQMAVGLLEEFAEMDASRADDLDPVIPELTPREKDLLELLGQGLSNKEISAKLYISESTVKNHLRNIMEKLHIHNRTQAAAYAVRAKLAARPRTKRPQR